MINSHMVRRCTELRLRLGFFLPLFLFRLCCSFSIEIISFDLIKWSPSFEPDAGGDEAISSWSNVSGLHSIQCRLLQCLAFISDIVSRDRHAILVQVWNYALLAEALSNGDGCVFSATVRFLSPPVIASYSS